jgi:hypothetical protein
VKYKHIKVNSCGVVDRQSATKKLLHNILEDYCKRFKVEPISSSVKVDVCYIDMEHSDSLQGLTIIDQDQDTLDHIFVQVRDPQLDLIEISLPVERLFNQTVCHEFVHVCQHLTNRKGMQIKGIMDKTSGREKYCFDPLEVEARVLQDLYADLYVKELL